MARLPIPFSNPTTYPGHTGVDYGVRQGTHFRASGSGVVTRRTYNDRCGNAVWVQYDSMPAGAEVGHCHLDNYTDSPGVGTRVIEGTVLGRVGNSGNSTGPHLHQEVRNYATTDGYWKFFDPNRVVGGGSSGGVVQANQRVAGPNGANARPTPDRTQPAVADRFIKAGDVGTFDGWIRGEAVEGNNVWFHGAYSGLWFWSGGFTDKGTHDLADMNPAQVQPHQRVAGPNGAKQRHDPSTGQPEGGFLQPGTIGDFNGWIRGQNVEGNDIWFRGLHSGMWSWSGGFTDKGTHDLADLNPPDPGPGPDGNERTAVAAGAKVRSTPYVNAAQTGFITGDTAVSMLAFAHAEAVEGNDVWFRHATGWSWSGGFTSASTANLPEETAPPKPNPGNPLNPLGLPQYTPVYPRAVIGLEAPLGFVDCVVGGVRASRKQKGNPPVPTDGVIRYFIIHWTGVTADQTVFFSQCNDRGSCPTTYVNGNAETTEFIRPGAKPAATGADWNYRSWAVEVQMLGGPIPISDEQIDEVIEQMVFLREHNGSLLDGAPVEFLLDREHVIGDRDTRATTCPGDYLYGKIPWMIEEAQRRYDERHPEPTDQYVVPVELGNQIRTLVNEAFPTI